ncbi:dephospho-CoA kinase [Vulcaniibacterium tengchongense]|uniref:Dephospho-CoA kinase n=1 Tax=Vulcaniibacterium tengchongense TaxID=1273429 RepID=A0A3N4VCH9_9GAMM|nr:dephospho-CoA kinase [Vulcaniibacterium tengchongense]RPE79513.1 dephospho-CoA kinase [Vulcaniibacterium tengchongense]
MSSFVVGVTGGIASGKSEITRRFQALGVFVADADVAAREAVAPGSPGLAEVVASFGEDVLAADGSLDRAAMRRRVFGDDAARHRLEAIVHPHVRRVLQDACATAPGPYAIAAIPLLAEGGGYDTYPWLGRILVVDVPVEAQRERLMRRDGIDAALAERMIAAQATRAQRLAIADDVIVNDGSLADLDAHIAALDRRYRALAEQLQALDTPLTPVAEA